MLGTYHLTALFDILKEVHFIYEPTQLWKYILEQSCKTLQCEAATFFEINEETKELRITASFGINESRLSQLPFKVGVGICGWVAQYQQPALVNDVTQDNRFTRAIDHVTGFKTKSILCVPVFTPKHSYGVVEVLNKKSGPYPPQDQEFMTILARQTAVAYQNLLLISEVRQSKVWIESLLGSLSGGLIAAHADGRISIMNPSAARLLGIQPQPDAGQPMDRVFKDYPWLIEIIQVVIRTKGTVSRQETTLTVNGQPTRFGYSTILVADAQQQVLGAGIIFQKLT